MNLQIVNWEKPNSHPITTNFQKKTVTAKEYPLLANKYLILSKNIQI